MTIDWDKWLKEITQETEPASVAQPEAQPELPVEEQIAVKLGGLLDAITAMLQPIDQLALLKDDTTRVFSNQSFDQLSDKVIDCRRANYVHLDILVAGTSPSAVISLEGATEQGGNYVPLPGASQLVTRDTAIDWPVGARFVKVRLASVSGTFTVIATPYSAASESVQRPFAIKTVTIANGASLSGEVDLGGYALAAIQMPSAWTAANLTFQAATASGGTFQEVYDDLGNELTVQAAASRCIGIDSVAGALAPLRFIKIRSGTAATPVNQAADRTLTLILKG